MSGYREWRPPAELRGVVACLWEHGGARTGAEQVVVPDGCVDLIWREGRIEIAGPDTGPWTSALAPGERLRGIRASPGAAPLLLGVPARELRDLRVDGTDLWGPRSTGLAERIGAEPERAGSELVEFALARLSEWRADPAVGAAVAALDQSRPPSVRRLAADLGLSERQLRRRLVDSVGYGPSALVGVLRFQRAARLGRRLPVAEAAALAGYADQAHLGREFRRLTGLTPRRYLSRS
ncbi:helix-turn-helix domain-containing protein [Saccharopolyspora griseoalba]|uniref:Helix-turn-helix domain-containing protein n=1 Tax=Saccharopolyspora griseoalba TaxID=1431848 RepID=A0ABW2LKL2_9PSEU